MKFKIFRTSDRFMECYPNPKWSPHHSASWNTDNWVIDIKSVEQLMRLINDPSVRLIIRDGEIEIDDVTLVRKI